MARRIPSVTVYQRGPSAFSVRYREDGRSREERGYTTRADAEDRAAELRRSFRSGLSGVPAPVVVADLAAVWWREYVDAGKVQAATRTSYRTAMRRILESLGDADARSLTTADVSAWHARLEVSDRAANIALTALSSIFQRAVERGELATNPARGVRRHREQRRTVEIPTPQDVARLAMSAPSGRERGMLLVACYAGLRQGELRALTVGDLIQGRIRVRGAAAPGNVVKQTKTYAERVVPVPVPVWEWVEAYAAGRPGGEFLFHDAGRMLDKDVWRRRVWTPWSTEAGCKGMLWRHLRHYCASQWAASGASLLQCSRWMGHSTFATTVDRYAFLFDHDEARVMDALARR